MSERKIDSSRREFVKTMALLPAASLLAFSGRAMAAMLSVDDPLAKSLGYIEATENPDQTCANCALYNAEDDSKGGCTIFPGRSVTANGWCKSWAAKP